MCAYVCLLMSRFHNYLLFAALCLNDFRRRCFTSHFENLDPMNLTILSICPFIIPIKNHKDYGFNPFNRFIIRVIIN